MDNGHSWKRLTVGEAAESLQISEDAVRKRVQRGTLRNDKTLDGRVYVYLEDKKSEVPDRGKGDWSGILQILAAVVVPLGTLGYAVGLVAIWLPIQNTYTDDFVTAWHAVSLVPTTMVAGLGVRYLLWSPLVWTTVYIPLALAVRFSMVRGSDALRNARFAERQTTSGPLPTILGGMYRVRQSLSQPIAINKYFVMGAVGAPLALAIVYWVFWGPGPAIEQAFYTLTILVGGLLAFYIVPALRRAFSKKASASRDTGDITRGRFILRLLLAFYLSYFVSITGRMIAGYLVADHPITPHVSTSDAAFQIYAFYVGPLVGLYVLGPTLARAFSGDKRHPLRLVSIKHLLLSTVGLFAYLFSASVLVATQTQTDPPLPTVEITGQSHVKDDLFHVKGDLLVHSEGFWYIFDTKGANKGQLRAVRDDKVENVTLFAQRKPVDKPNNK